MYATQRFLPNESLPCFDVKSEFTEAKERLVETERLRRRIKFSGSKYSAHR